METTSAPLPAADPWAIAAFLGYLALMGGIGLWAARFASRDVGHFFIGGRRMHRFVVALSAVVSGRSAWLLLGVTGLAWTRGLSAIWAIVGYTAVEAALFLWYAPRLRRFSERYDCVTLPDVFAARLGDRGPLRLLLVFVIVIFMASYLAAQFVGGGKAMAAGFGLPEGAGILLTAGIVLGYTALGGFLAVSLTDMVQACVMLLALLAVPLLAGTQIGWDVVMATLRALDPALLDPTALSAGALLGFLGIGLGSPGNPHILVRYMSIADAGQLRWAAIVGTTWNTLMGIGAIAIGLIGRAALPTAAQLPGGDTETLFPTLAQMHLPPVLFGIVVAAIFAAIMSTADSQLLVAASAVVRDVWQKALGRGDADPRALVRLSRFTVAGLVVAALLFGTVANQVVFWLVLFAWAGLGAALGPPSILMLFWKRTTAAGAAAGVVTGAVTVIVWYFVPPLKASLYELIPAFLLSAAATVIVSLRTTPPDDVDTRWRALFGD